MFKTLIICTAIVFSSHCFAQRTNPTVLFGEWKIVAYKELEIITPGMENDEERTERLKEDAMRAKGLFQIDSNGISTTNKSLSFDNCKFNLIHNSVSVNIVENDYSAGYSSSFDLWFDSSKASKDFIAILDKRYSKKTLNVFNTDYKVDYGNETLKICMISTNKIALYRDFDVIVLNRITLKNIKK